MACLDAVRLRKSAPLRRLVRVLSRADLDGDFFLKPEEVTVRFVSWSGPLPEVGSGQGVRGARNVADPGA